MARSILGGRPLVAGRSGPASGPPCFRGGPARVGGGYPRRADTRVVVTGMVAAATRFVYGRSRGTCWLMSELLVRAGADRAAGNRPGPAAYHRPSPAVSKRRAGRFGVCGSRAAPDKNQAGRCARVRRTTGWALVRREPQRPDRVPRRHCPQHEQVVPSPGASGRHCPGAAFAMPRNPAGLLDRGQVDQRLTQVATPPRPPPQDREPVPANPDSLDRRADPPPGERPT